MFYRLILQWIIACVLCTNAVALERTTQKSNQVPLRALPGFFRLSFDPVKMPNLPQMGLLGIDYFADLNSLVYGGVGVYGSVTGTQGGLFVVGLGGGIHPALSNHLLLDMGLFAGGGGGRSSLVGGGLMLRPHAGLQYRGKLGRIGAHYSYITFPSGLIRSHQVGVDLDMPFDFYYTKVNDLHASIVAANQILLPIGRFLVVDKNDFMLLIQAYRQKAGTLNVNKDVQDGTVKLVGAELDHYVTENLFWYLKTSGAFSGNPNGYMDILAGLGLRMNGAYGIALMPQLAGGAGGGGNVDTGGGILLAPQVSVEVPLTSQFALRASGGYVWAPNGELNAYTATGSLVYHLDVASGARRSETINGFFRPQIWRIRLLNQTYFHPQRTFSSRNTPINLFALQIDQVFNSFFYLAYQGSFAYSGFHAGGYATGMLGAGLQTPLFWHERARGFAEVLLGAGGGGSLALGGGAIVEPVVGLQYAVTDTIGLTGSVGQLKAISHDLSTPVVNLGVTFNFALLNQLIK